MANVVIMPKQGQSVESCIVSEFKVKVGDSVKVGDILFGYETDKATFEEESKFDGPVLAIFWNDGDEIPCLENVLVIGEPGESFEEFAPKGSGDSASAPEGAPSQTVVSDDPSHRKRWAPPSYNAEGGMGSEANTIRSTSLIYYSVHVLSRFRGRKPLFHYPVHV